MTGRKKIIIPRRSVGHRKIFIKKTTARVIIYYSPGSINRVCPLGLLYISPELLRCYNSSIQTSFGTQKGDVYSFSIILYELHSRKGPFGENHGLGVSDILRKIIYYSQENSNPFRYRINNFNSTTKVKNQVYLRNLL